MCLIVLRQPNVILSKSDFEVTVKNNPDGWGLSVPDGEGTLLTQRVITTDWEELYDLLHTEFKSDKLMLHLRYTTAGDTVIRNSHPFPVLEKEADGVDLRVAHNGTLYKYSPGFKDENQWESDTRVFVREYIRPLFKRMSKGHTSEDMLTDPFIHRLLDGELTAASVLTFIDGHGNTMIVNEEGNGGFTNEDGTYFSNKYSFDPTHRQVKGYSGGSNYNMGKFQDTQTNQTTSTGSNGCKSTTPSKLFTDCNTPTFSSVFEITDDEELFFISDESIDSLVKDDPENAVLLIKELMFKFYTANDKLSRATRTLQHKAKVIKDLENKTCDKKENLNGKAA